ncbi:MAG TPA: SUMF1/EgtB/PvdO family nonheme iron enzyme, partial [Kiritimatiellia bacterium]|nr:SUMF1/EgtB/PvdO family nonheme iron enzyme [Kiritimatiellia bacterium]
MKSPRPAGAALQGDPFSLADLQRAIDIWPTNEDREDRFHAAVLHAGMPDESADPPGPTMFTLEEIYLKLVETQEDVQATQSQLQSVQQDVQAAQSLLQSVEERLAAAGIGAPPGMSLIPAGPFQMGDNYRVEGAAGPVHTVNISAFYMDKFQVTNED